MGKFVVGWFGYGGHSWQADQFREELLNEGIELKTCHEYPNADVSYDQNKIFEFIDSVDAIICPARFNLEPAKSVNRLSLAWSRGKPCVVAPLDAYLKYVVDGKNALVAMNRDGFISAIRKLRDDPPLRSLLAGNGKDTAYKFLHPREMVRRFFEELRSVGIGVKNNWPNVFVQIVIPHYSDDKRYLNVAIKSVLESDGPERDILVVSSSKIDPRSDNIFTQHFGGNAKVRVYHQTDRLSFSQANNIGIKESNKNTTHFLFLNDDTILNKTSLGDLLNEIGDRIIILNPYSNCDKGWLHNDKLEASGKDLHPNMTIEEFGDNLNSLQEYKPPQSKSELVEAPFCAMYATLIPKNAINRIGMLNTTYSNGGEDADYSYRAQKMGINTFWTRNSFIFHFGGKTRKFSQDQNPTKHVEEDQFNNSLLQKKWPQKKITKRLGIWTGPAWEIWDLDSYKTGGLGGAETCEGRLAETAAKNGWQVTMYGAHHEKEQYGVKLLPWNVLQPEEEYFDVFIASRNLNCLDTRLKARKVFAHIHDIWAISGKFISKWHYERIDKFVTLSPWHAQFFMAHHEVPEQYRCNIIIIPNGVNVELFD